MNCKEKKILATFVLTAIPSFVVMGLIGDGQIDAGIWVKYLAAYCGAGVLTMIWFWIYG